MRLDVVFLAHHQDERRTYTNTDGIDHVLVAPGELHVVIDAAKCGTAAVVSFGMSITLRCGFWQLAMAVSQARRNRPSLRAVPADFQAMALRKRKGWQRLVMTILDA